MELRKNLRDKDESLGDATEKPAVPSYGVLLFICCAVTGACYFGSYLRVPVVPLYARSLGADAFDVGLINSAFLFTAGVVSLPVGILSDRVGRKLLILAGLVLSSLSSFLLCYSTSALQMAAVYLIFGLGLAMFAPTMMSYVADITPATHLGRAYGWYTTALYVGMSVGPATGGMVAEWWGFRPLFAVSGIVILLVFGFAVFLLPRARHVRINPVPQRDLVVVMRDLSRNVALLACWVATLGGCFALGMFVTFVPLHAYEQGANTAQIGLIFAVQAAFNALSRIPFGRLIDRVGRRSNLVVPGLLGLSGAMAGFGLASEMSAFLLCAVGLGVSMGIAFTAIGAIIPEVVPTDARGMAMGGYNSSIFLGMMLSSLVMGALVGELGFKHCFLIVALTNVVTTGIFERAMTHSSGDRRV